MLTVTILALCAAFSSVSCILKFYYGIYLFLKQCYGDTLLPANNQLSNATITTKQAGLITESSTAPTKPVAILNNSTVHSILKNIASTEANKTNSKTRSTVKKVKKTRTTRQRKSTTTKNQTTKAALLKLL